MKPIENQTFALDEIRIKVYNKRWAILSIFTLCAAASTFQWMQFVIISNTIQKYYHVNKTYVNWTSVVFMISNAVISFFACYIIQRKGARVVTLLAVMSSLLGSLIKIFADTSDLFCLAMIGQVFAAISHVFIVPLPPKIASIWFTPEEYIKAVAIGMSGFLLGIALGMIIPSLALRNQHGIGSTLNKFYWGQFLAMILISLNVIFYYPKQPSLPPTEVQVRERKKLPPTWKEFYDTFIDIVKRRGSILIVNSFGINVGLFLNFIIYMNQFVLSYFEDGEKHTGIMGFLLIKMGVIGCVIFALVQEKTKKYKEVVIFIYYMTALSATLFLGALEFKRIFLVYLTSCIFGLFSISSIIVGFEHAIEVIYPIDEITVITYLSLSSFSYGFIISIITEVLLKHFDTVWVLTGMIIVLLFGALLIHLVPNVKNRQDEIERKKIEEEEALNKNETKIMKISKIEVLNKNVDKEWL